MLTSSLFQQTVIPVLEQTLAFSQARHEVLAGNIANADTPGYVARDLSVEAFQAHLRQVAADRQAARQGLAAGSLRTTANQGILYHDMSNDSLEHQVAALAKNQMQHNLAIAILTHQFAQIRAAIAGR